MDELPKLLVSACLLGKPVRYDGTANPLRAELLEKWGQEGRVVGVCPEMLAGFATPRLPAEITLGMSGSDVLNSRARVVESDGADVTAQFLRGATAATKSALGSGCTFALLTDGSPSCGSMFVYDGSFTGRRHPGQGVATALLRSLGIAVYSPDRFDELARVMEPARPED